MKTVLTVVALGLFAVLVGGLVTAEFGQLAGLGIVTGVIVLAALIARENQQRKSKGEPPLIGRRKDDSP